MTTGNWGLRDLHAATVMVPIFKAGGSPTVAASFGVVPGKPILFDTSTRQGVDDLYEAARQAQAKGHSAFLNLTSWAEVGPTLRGDTSTPHEELHILWADVDRFKGGMPRKVNHDLIKKLRKRGCAVSKSPGGSQHLWFFMRDPMDAAEFQRLNTKLKHAIGADDKDNIVNFLRVPYAPSFKEKHIRADGTAREATVMHFSEDLWDNKAFEKLLDSEGFSVPERARRVQRTNATPIVAEAVTEDALPARVRRAYRSQHTETSEGPWKFWCLCAENGVTEGQAVPFAPTWLHGRKVVRGLNA